MIVMDAVREEATRTVTIPACTDHDGRFATEVRLRWACPVCGGPRGEPGAAWSHDGSRRLAVNGWTNACGHVDFYSAIRREAGAA